MIMRRKIKIGVIILFVLNFIAIGSFAAFAADKNTVSGKCNVNGRKVTVSVSISENSGIMGFGLKVKYPAEILKNPIVSKGKLTCAGMLNDSINEKTNGSFDVIWSNSDDVTEDGTLFVIELELSEGKTLNGEAIELSCLKQDTFNSKWEDVELNCQRIILNTVNETVTDGEKSDGSDIESVDSGYLSSAIGKALDNQGTDNIDSLDEEQFKKLKSDIDSSLKAYGFDGGVESMGKDELKKVYRDSSERGYIEKTLLERDGEDIISAVEYALKNVGVGSVDEVDSGKAEAFVTAFNGKLNESGEADAFPENLSEDEKLETVKQLYENVLKENSPENKVEIKNTGIKPAIIIFIAVISLSVLIYVFIKIRTKSKYKRGEII